VFFAASFTTRLSIRRPARVTRTFTRARLPGAIENAARPRRARLAVSFVRPEQAPIVAAGQRSVTVTILRENVSLVDTSLTPAKAAGGVVRVEPVEVEPVGIEPVGVEPVGVEPAGAAVVNVRSSPALTPPALLATSLKW